MLSNISRPEISSRAITNPDPHINVDNFDRSHIIPVYDSDTSEPTSVTPLINNPRKRRRMHIKPPDDGQPTASTARDSLLTPNTLPSAARASVAPPVLDQTHPANGLRRNARDTRINHLYN